MRKSHLIFLIIVLAVGLGVRFALIAADSDTLVRVIPDDAFYYFKTAQHIVAGQGSTFDGVHAANGYHPLWLLLLLPAANASDPLVLARSALLLGCLLSVLSTLILWKSMQRVNPVSWLPLPIAGLYFLAPRVIAASLNGLETSLATALFAAAFYVTIVMTYSSIKYDVSLGVLLGLLFLARTDTVFYAAAFWLIAVVRAARPARLRRGLLVLGVAGVTIAPWLIWNWITFGSPLQVSGFAVPYVIRELKLLSGLSLSEYTIVGLQLFILFPFLSEIYGWIACAGLLALWYFLRMAPVLARVTVDLFRRMLAAVLLLWLSSTALIFVHTYIRRFPRDWYFAQLDWLSAVTLFLVICVLGATPLWRKVQRRFAARSPSVRRGAYLLGGLLIGLLVALVWEPGNRELFTAGVYPYQVEYLDAARWLKANTREDETAAAFNAGIIGYFSDRRVVNLDGVMDNAAFDAIRERRLWNFMREANVSYYLDYDPLMLKMYAPFMGSPADRVELTEVHVIDRPGVAWQDSKIKIYRLAWQP